MSAPPSGHPVAITIGTVWRFDVNPSPPTQLQLPVEAVIAWVVLALARVIFGTVYFRDCPQQPYIPIYLLGMALGAMWRLGLVTFPSVRHRPRELRGFRAFLTCLLDLYISIMFLAGTWWVFSVYQPNYDPTAADGLYCNKTLYTFAFWNVVFEIFGLAVAVVTVCKGMLCYVIMTPAPEDRVYGQV
ncbi:transmembrane protein 272-like isoform 1-T1 [Pholidichthys leucotaenia]